jgi:outer membrane murein-binding lipoprotein Lpp
MVPVAVRVDDAWEQGARSAQGSVVAAMGRQVMMQFYVGVIIVVYLMMGALTGYQRLKINSLNKQVVQLNQQIDTLNRDLEIARANYQTTEQAILQCNKGIEQLKEEARRRLAEAESERARVVEENRKLHARAVAIISTPRPQGMDACQNAERIINEEIDRNRMLGGDDRMRLATTPAR